MVKKNKSERNDLRRNEEYFNGKKKGYYARDYYSSTLNKRKFTEELIKEAKHTQYKKNQVKVATIRLTKAINDTNMVELYSVSRAFITYKVDEGGEWYLDSCTLRQICNNDESYLDFRLKL